MTAVECVSEELRNLDIAYEMGLDKYEFQKLRKELVNKAKEMERKQAHEYAEFAIRCDRKMMKILNFEDWVKL
jgi:hypothetical protein